MAPPEAARTRRPRRHEPPEARRAQILEAALRCFSEKGYHEATMDDLAREAGLSKGSLYWHFAGKAEVFAGLAEVYALELFGAWQREAAAHRGGVVALLGRVGSLSIAHIGQQGELLRAWAELLVHRAVQERFRDIYRESRRLLAEWIRRGIREGEIRAVDPEALAAAFTASVEGLLIQMLVDPEFDVERGWRTSWDVLARGIAA